MVYWSDASILFALSSDDEQACKRHLGGLTRVTRHSILVDAPILARTHMLTAVTILLLPLSEELALCSRPFLSGLVKAMSVRHQRNNSRTSLECQRIVTACALQCYTLTSGSRYTRENSITALRRMRRST